jgi:hypothetical protein
MEYEQICHRIHMQILDYQRRHNLWPNRIVLGNEVFDFMLSHNQDTVTRFSINDGYCSYTMFGISVVKNIHNPREISVGYVEEVGL